MFKNKKKKVEKYDIKIHNINLVTRIKCNRNHIHENDVFNVMI